VGNDAACEGKVTAYQVVKEREGGGEEKKKKAPTTEKGPLPLKGAREVEKLR